MKGAGAAVKVGLTALGIALLAFFAFKFVSKGISGPTGYRVWALFHDATGLVDKSRVQIAGLNIGEIMNRYLEKGMPLAHIDIRIKPGTALYSNATIFKKSSSLLGEYYLEIDPGTASEPDPKDPSKAIPTRLLQDGDQIVNVVEAVTTTDILVQVQETLPVLRAILTDVQKITQGPLQEIAKSVQKGVDRNSEAAERLLNHVDQIALDIRGITGGPSNGDIKKSISNIREITESVKSLVGKGEGEVTSTGDKLRQNLDKIGMAVDNLNRTLDNIAVVSDKVRGGEGTVGRLLNDDTIANNVEQITEDAGSFLRSLTRLQTLVGLRSEYNVLANTLKTYVGIQLQSRPDKYYLIELIDDPRGLRTENRTFTTTDDPSKPQTTNTTTITTSDKFRFSFQLAKRLFLLNGRMILTGRFGIKESTGGIGGDVEIPLSLASNWMKTLEIKLDLFDFRTNTYPRLKILAALEFYKHIWIVGGVDDVINGRQPGTGGFTGRDYFFGIQLTFNDEDLRALLTVGGAALLTGAR
jgi:phospholipid/cholesterol/gamma-HCH transport system substrate-binding protein